MLKDVGMVLAIIVMSIYILSFAVRLICFIPDFIEQIQMDKDIKKLLKKDKE